MTSAMAVDALLVAGIYLGGGFVLILVMWSSTEPLLLKRFGAALAASGIAAGVGTVLLTRDWTLPLPAWAPLICVLPIVGLTAEAMEKWWKRRHEVPQ